MLNLSRFDPLTIVFMCTLLPTNSHLSNYRVYQFLNPRFTQLLPKIYTFSKNIKLEKLGEYYVKVLRVLSENIYL